MRGQRRTVEGRRGRLQKQNALAPDDGFLVHEIIDDLDAIP
jgi:hypothetical protein